MLVGAKGKCLGLGGDPSRCRAAAESSFKQKAQIVLVFDG